MNQPVSARNLDAVATEDWDCLFRAVLDRLRVARGSTQDIQPTVLECVGALEKLHEMLVNERRRARASTMQAILIKRLTKPLKLQEQDSPLRDEGCLAL